MEEMGLFKQGWRLFQYHKHAFLGVNRARDKLAPILDRHWPVVYSFFKITGRIFLMLMLQWRDSVARGSQSLISFGSVALFVIAWSFIISFTSTWGLVFVLLSLGFAGTAIRCLGYTPGLFIVGLFAILILWIFGNVWITGLILIVGGYMFSLNNARILVFLSTAYAVYSVNTHSGWLGVFLSLNLSFLSNDLLSKLLQGCDAANASTKCEEEKESEPAVEDFYENFCNDFHEGSKYTPTNEAENLASEKSCEPPSDSNFLNIKNQKVIDSCSKVIDSCSKVVLNDSRSLDEVNRIINSVNHYEALGFARNKNIDPEMLKREYRAKARLVHPDKNMGSPLASKSFQKLQSAYEILSNLSKKTIYDEQLKKEDSGRVSQKPRVASRQEGVDYRTEESRLVQCTKCANSHIWICTNRSKIKARWCQDCSQYHQARDGDGWVESGSSFVLSRPHKVEIPRAFVCAESKIFDVSEWAICQGMSCKPNTHRPSFHVKMAGLERAAHRSNSSSRYPWGLNAHMMMMPDDDECDLWLQQALASSLFSNSPKRRKSWIRFKISQRSLNLWRRSL